MLHKFLTGTLLFFAAQFAAAAPADDIKQLLGQGRAAEAYALGQNSPDELGKPDFDFNFGVAAIDAGHASEGVLALERFLLQFPENALARLELARGYFVLGDLVRAREEFEETSKRNPPPSVRATIDRFIEAIRVRETRYTSSSLSWLELGLGTDSNVNGGVSGAAINLPNFGPVVVTGAGVKTGDIFTHVAGGAQFSKPIAPGVQLFGSLQGEGKLNRNDTDFSQTNLGAAGGVAMLGSDNVYRLTLGYNTIAVQSERFRNASTLTGEWVRQLDELRSVNMFAQYADFRYLGANEVRGSGFYALGGGLRQAFIGSMQPVLQLQANIGQEDNRHSRDDLSRDLYGGRAALSITPTPQWGLSAGLSQQESRYSSPDTLLLTTRKDRYFGVDVGATYLYSKNISVRGELVYAKNVSNISLFTYDRTTALVKLRYEFK